MRHVLWLLVPILCIFIGPSICYDSSSGSEVIPADDSQNNDDVLDRYFTAKMLTVIVMAFASVLMLSIPGIVACITCFCCINSCKKKQKYEIYEEHVDPWDQHQIISA
jgi:hypothetical protein